MLIFWKLLWVGDGKQLINASDAKLSRPGPHANLITINIPLS